MKKIKGFCCCSFTFIFFQILFWGCTKQKVTDESILATIGPEKISVRDFRISYELSPATPEQHSSHGLEAKKARLNTIVENKLLSFAGKERHLDADDGVKKLLSWYEKQAVIRALYRKVIRDSVHVTEAEIQTAFLLLNEKVVVRQILTPTLSDAEKLYHRLRNGESFEDVALGMVKNQKDLQYVLTPREFTWGELDENLETALFGLNRNEVSAPVKTRAGYHIVQLLNRKKNLLLNEYAYQEKKHYVETIIRRRKESKLARAYATRLMEQVQPRAVGAVLKELVQRAQKAVRLNKEQTLPPYMQVHAVEPYVQDLLSKDLVVFRGGSWTVQEFLERIKNVHPESRPDLTDAGKLKIALSVMVRDEFLARKGYEQQLNRSPEVVDEIRRLKDDLAGMRMRSALLDTVGVSADEVRAYFQQHIVDYQIPAMARVEELMVRRKELADSLHAALLKGAEFRSLARRYSIRKWTAEKGGDLGYITKSAFGDIGVRALRMEIGALSEPVPLRLSGQVIGYSVFRVLDKKPTQTPDLASIRDRVSKDALRFKRQSVLAAFLAKTEQRYPVHIEEGILREIKTTDDIAPGRPIDILKVSRL